MKIDWNKIQTGAQHFVSAATSFMIGLVHFAAAAAPVAESVAQSTGHSDVVGDIHKAGEAAKAASSLADSF